MTHVHTISRRRCAFDVKPRCVRVWRCWRGCALVQCVRVTCRACVCAWCGTIAVRVCGVCACACRGAVRVWCVCVLRCTCHIARRVRGAQSCTNEHASWFAARCRAKNKQKARYAAQRRHSGNNAMANSGSKSWWF